MVHLTVNSVLDSRKFGINFIKAMEDSSACVFSGLILSQINTMNKITCNYSVTTTEDVVFFILGNNLPGIIKLCLNLNQRRQLQKLFQKTPKAF